MLGRMAGHRGRKDRVGKIGSQVLKLPRRNIGLPGKGRVLGLQGFDAVAAARPRHESVRMIRENRSHMARHRQFPRIYTYRLRQCRDAFTSHTSSSRPMPCGQKVNTNPDRVRRAPTIHCLIMDIALHPWRPLHLAKLGTHYKVTLSGGEQPPFGDPTIQRLALRRKWAPPLPKLQMHTPRLHLERPVQAQNGSQATGIVNDSFTSASTQKMRGCLLAAPALVADFRRSHKRIQPSATGAFAR